jgi:hypothetical protein
MNCHPERSEGPHEPRMKALRLHDDEPKPGGPLYRNNKQFNAPSMAGSDRGDGRAHEDLQGNRLVYYECFHDPRDAIAGEKEIKGWRRKKKNTLVETKNPGGADLSPMLFQHFKPSSRASAPTGTRQ